MGIALILTLKTIYHLFYVINQVESLQQQTLIPTSEQLAAFLAQERNMKAETRARINNLITQVF